MLLLHIIKMAIFICPFFSNAICASKVIQSPSAAANAVRTFLYKVQLND